MNTNELFKSVDADGNNQITEFEWLKFWEAVKIAGYSEEEILEEVRILFLYLNLFFMIRLLSQFQIIYHELCFLVNY